MRRSTRSLSPPQANGSHHLISTASERQPTTRMTSGLAPITHRREATVSPTRDRVSQPTISGDSPAPLSRVPSPEIGCLITLSRVETDQLSGNHHPHLSDIKSPPWATTCRCDLLRARTDDGQQNEDPTRFAGPFHALLTVSVAHPADPFQLLALTRFSIPADTSRERERSFSRGSLLPQSTASVTQVGHLLPTFGGG